MNSPISRLKNSLAQIADPRSKQGISHPFAGILALVLLGKIARQIYMTPIVEWATAHGRRGFYDSSPAGSFG